MMSYSRTSELLTTGTVSADAIQAWLDSNVEWGAGVVGLPQTPIPADIGQIIVEESARYYPIVLNHDLVAAQINHESAALQSRIARDKLNYCGYGAENDDPYGKAYTFSTPREGVRTQIAHLLGYVMGDGRWTMVSPRYSIVKANGWAGSVKELHQLEQKWAYTAPAKYAVTGLLDRYGAKIAAHANRLVDFANDGIWGVAEPQIIRRILPRNASNTPQRTMSWEWITVHNTGNPNPSADALMHASWLESLAASGKGEPSWQYTVDDKRIVQHLEDDQAGWHASDGNGPGNLASLGFELVEVGDQNTVLANAAWIIARKLKSKSYGTDRVKQHHDFARDGKNCPRLLRANNGAGWNKLLAMIEGHLDDAPSPPVDDAWRIQDNPFGNYGWKAGFRATVEALARAKYPQDVNASALSIVGYAKSDEFQGVDGCAYQPCERTTLKYNPAAIAPFDIVFMLPQTPLPERKPT